MTVPGIPSFRTPVEIDVTKINIPILIQSLHSCGVEDYEIKTVSKTGVIKELSESIDIPKKKKDNSKIDKRLDRLEDLLLSLVSKKSSQRSNSSEQIKNRLVKIESMIKSGRSSNKDISPIIEEMDEQYIPSIDVSNMQITGKTTEVIDKKSNQDIDNAVDLLSNLTKNGGK